MNQQGRWLRNLIEKHAAEIPDQIFLQNEDGSKNIFFSDAFRKIKTIDSDFLKNHIKECDAIAVILKRGVEQAMMMTSLLSLGKKALMIPSESRTKEVLRIMQELPFNFLIIEKDSEYLLLFRAEFVQVSDIDNLVLLQRVKLRNQPSAFSWLLMTSGSTGSPKAVMLSEITLQQRSISETDLFKIKPQSHLLNVLSLSHDLGLNQLLTAIQTGSTLEIFTKKLPMDFIRRLQIKNYDGITGVPSTWRNLISHCKKLNLVFQNSFFLTVSGGSLTTTELCELKKIFLNAKIYKTYGQTETFRSLAETNQEVILSNIVGAPIAGVNIFLTEEGELIHTGEGCFLGYWLDQELTQKKRRPLSQFIKTLSNEVAVATGDYFRISPYGAYEYLGRKDDLVKINGRRFYLSEVEHCLLQHPAVNNAAVIMGEPANKPLGVVEGLVAFVSAGVPLDSMQLKKFCAAHLEPCKVPIRYIFLEEFPLTATGKTDRQMLRLKGAEIFA